MYNALAYQLLSISEIKRIIALVSTTTFQFQQVLRHQNVGNFIINSVPFLPSNFRDEFAGRIEAFIRCEKA